MRPPFWPDKAWSTLVGPAWPPLAIDSGSDSDRVRTALAAYWKVRLDAVRPPLLSEDMRARFADHDGTRDVEVQQVGYEWLARAAAMEPCGFWFMEVGSAALGMVARQRAGQYETVQRALVQWNSAGSEAAAEVLAPLLTQASVEAGWGHVLQSIIDLWHDRQPTRAIARLDRAATLLGATAFGALGVSAPLMYGFAMALEGNVREGAELLQEWLRDHEDAPDHHRAEVMYHLARYLWSMELDQQATDALVSAVEMSPAHLLRFASDPAWGSAPAGASMPTEVLGRAAEKLRTQMVRWQRRVTAPDQGQDAFREVRYLLSFASDTYALFAASAARRIALAHGAEEPYHPPVAFAGQLQGLREFARSLPADILLSFGPDAPLLREQVAEIEQYLVENPVEESLVHHVQEIVSILPRACKVCVFEHAQRIARALEAAQQMANAEDEEAQKFFRTMMRRCIRVAGGLESLPDRADAALARATADQWNLLHDVIVAWSKRLKRLHGEVRIIAEADTVVSAGDRSAARVRIVDARGEVVAGVPLVWSVASGPAVPREAGQCLRDCWTLSLSTGKAYLPLSVVDGQSTEGTIAVATVGDRAPIILTYSVK
jgi:hypothetical protein